jgi:transcriptional regulator with XRE-family HTH domain
VERVLDTIRLALRLLDVTNRHVENRLGMSHGYLSRVLAGHIELRLSHVLDIAEVLGLAPAELFDLAWPLKPQPPTPAAARLHHLLRSFRPAPPEPLEPAAPAAHDELAGLLRRVLEELGPRRAPLPAAERG